MPSRRRGNGLGPEDLGPEDEALWARVAATVRPLRGRPRQPLNPSALAPIEPRPAAPEPPRLSRQTLAKPVDGATLDGGWERRLRSGKLAPDLTIDLHGYSRDRAHALLVRRLEQAALHGQRVALVITGKGAKPAPADIMDDVRPRGVIRASLPQWLEAPALRPYVAALRPAHPRHGGSGAWYVILRRTR